MRYVLVLVLAILITGVAGTLAQEDKKEQSTTDFTGEWVMNLDKSGFEQDGEGRRRQGSPVTMSVKQDEKELAVTRVRTGRGGKEVKTMLTYSLKGKKTKNKTEFGTMESTAKWLDDGTSLELYSSTVVKREGMRFTVENIQTWSIVDDVLTIETVRNTPRGEMKSTAVYERKGAENAGKKAEGEKEKE